MGSSFQEVNWGCEPFNAGFNESSEYFCFVIFFFVEEIALFIFFSEFSEEMMKSLVHSFECFHPSCKEHYCGDWRKSFLHFHLCSEKNMTCCWKCAELLAVIARHSFHCLVSIIDFFQFFFFWVHF